MKTQTLVGLGAAALGLGVGILSVRFFRPALPPQGHVDPLLASINAQVRQHVSRPMALAVSVRDGRVELKGPILKSEIERLLALVCRTSLYVDWINRNFDQSNSC